VLAVQALSRLNRCNDKLEKKDTFVLDFYNAVEEIKSAFDVFYTSTSLSQPTDVNVLHDLKDALDDVGIYDWHEIQQFNELFFNSADADTLHPIIDEVVQRFDADLDEDEKIDYKIKAKQFVKIYAQVACIIPFNKVQWEMLHWFLKFLIPKLKVQDPDQDKLDELLNSIDLSTYGLERVKLNVMIGLDDSETEVDPQNPNPRGKQGEDERDPLDEIIRLFNDRFFAGWEGTEEEKRVKVINLRKHIEADPAFQSQVLDNSDNQNQRLAFEKIVQSAINKERRKDLDLYRNFFSDEHFQKGMIEMLYRAVVLQDKSSEIRP